MKFVCPNKNDKTWIGLVNKYGISKAYKMFMKNDYQIPVITREITDEFGIAVTKTLENLTIRIKIIESKVQKAKSKNDTSELENLRKVHEKLVEHLVNETHKEGLLFFAKELDNDINDIDEVIQNKSTSNVSARASAIRRSKSYVDSMIPIIDDITTFLIEKDMDAQEKEIFDILSSKRIVLQKKRKDLIESGRDIFAVFLTPFLGERNNPKLIAEINKNLPPEKHIKEFDILTALSEGDKDIHFLDKWLRSMGNSRNDILKLINEAVLRKKQVARINALEDRYNLAKIRDEYLKSGGSNFDWIYEKRKDGSLTGNFITNRRWNEYIADKEKYKESLLKDKYKVQFPNELSRTLHNEYSADLREWIDNNSDVDAVTKEPIPSLQKYGNEDYNKLNAAQLKALKALSSMKEQLDGMIHPKFRHPHRVPQVSKDFFERVKSIKDGGQIGEIFAGEFFNRDYDIDRGNISNTEKANVAYVLGDRGQEVELLPMHFTKKLGNMNRDLSLDIISSMVVYSNMARDYKEMNDIVDTLELGREILKEQKVQDTDFQGRVKKTVSYIGGTKIEKNLFKSDNLALDKYENFMSMIVYGKTRIEGPQINILGKKFDREKTLDKLGQLTAINALALNVYSGLSNILFGETMLATEAVAGQFFDIKDVTTGTTNYFGEVPGFLSQHGKVHNTSKLALWGERFDTLQDYKSEMHTIDAGRNTRFGRMMKLSSLFFLNNAGEHFMQNRSSLALASSVKLKDKSGKEINLWDAYEVKNGRLSLIDGVTKPDGSKWTVDDEVNFTRRQDFINQRMHGIYNENDMAAIQRYAAGRLAVMFRKFIVPGWDKRWESANYSYMLDDFTEGYYNTTVHFFGNVIKDMADMKFSLIKNWNELSDYRKGNVRKTMTEVSILLSTMILTALVLSGGEGDEDDWLANMLEYQARRLQAELMFYYMPTEALKILRSPAASISYLEDTIKFVGSLNPFVITDKIESGRYKDWYKWQRNALRITPLYKTVDKVMHPEEVLRWWN